MAKSDSGSSSKPFTRNFYEQAWRWATTHPDIHVYDGAKTYTLSLAEFESLERETGSAQNRQSLATRETHVSGRSTPVHVFPEASPSSLLVSLGDSLRGRLVEEDSLSSQNSKAHAIRRNTFLPETRENVGQNSASEPGVFCVVRFPPSLCQQMYSRHAQTYLSDYCKKPRQPREPRNTPGNAKTIEPVFDELPSTIACPRIFASQDRVWQAVTGHSIDLRKVPSMEFICLCVIATHGPGGITQPDLVKVTGQDKRSVPKRTDELARKGYIEKRPVQDGRLRTSLCVHKKFVKAGNFLSRPRSIDEVFGPDKFDFSGFVYLLHKLLTETPIVPMRELRKRMVILILIVYLTSC